MLIILLADLSSCQQPYAGMLTICPPMYIYSYRHGFYILKILYKVIKSLYVKYVKSINYPLELKLHTYKIRSILRYNTHIDAEVILRIHIKLRTLTDSLSYTVYFLSRGL
jgi:hypothetical protein